MSTYDKAKYYFEQGLWSEERLKILVSRQLLTEEEYKQITKNKPAD